MWPSWKFYVLSPFNSFQFCYFTFFSKTEQYYILGPYNILIILSSAVGNLCCLNFLALVNRRVKTWMCKYFYGQTWSFLSIYTSGTSGIRTWGTPCFSNEKHKFSVTALNVVWHPLSLETTNSSTLRCHITQSKWMPSICLTRSLGDAVGRKGLLVETQMRKWC